MVILLRKQREPSRLGGSEVWERIRRKVHGGVTDMAVDTVPRLLLRGRGDFRTKIGVASLADLRSKTRLSGRLLALLALAGRSSSGARSSIDIFFTITTVIPINIHILRIASASPSDILARMLRLSEVAESGSGHGSNPVQGRILVSWIVSRVLLFSKLGHVTIPSFDGLRLCTPSLSSNLGDDLVVDVSELGHDHRQDFGSVQHETIFGTGDSKLLLQGFAALLVQRRGGWWKVDGRRGRG